MSASDHLQPLQFKYDSPGPGAHQLGAYQGEQKVGHMLWDRKSGSILELRTHPDYRRQGVATGMFNHAQSFDPPAKHHSSRTPEGDAFAKSTGTPVPKLRKKIPSESTLGLTYEEARRM